MTIKWGNGSPFTRMPAAKLLPVTRKAVAAAPDRADLKVHLARMLYDADEMDEVVELLRPELGHENAVPELLFWLGQAALVTQDDRLALDALRSAAAKGMPNALGSLAAVLASLGREEEALEVGLEALKRAPGDALQ